MGLRATTGHSRKAIQHMNMIQKIRDSHLNRHGYIDVLIGVVVFQVFNFAMVLIFGNPENVKEEEYNIPLGKLLVMALLLAPYLSLIHI